MDSLYFFIYSSSPPCAMDERAPRTYVVRMIAVNDRKKKTECTSNLKAKNLGKICHKTGAHGKKETVIKISKATEIWHDTGQQRG